MQDRAFIDTNLLVHLANENSPYNSKLSQLVGSYKNNYDLWISRQVLREYAVVMSRPGVLETPLDSESLVSDLSRWDLLFFVADEDEVVTQHLKGLILRYKVQGKRIHDANIVATMMVYDIPNLLTMNTADFKQFSEVTLIDMGF